MYMQAQTFNISLPGELVTRMDIVAADEYRNRSELIREAIRVYLRDKEEWEDIFKFGREVGRKMKIKSEGDVNRIVEEYRHGKKNR